MLPTPTRGPGDQKTEALSDGELTRAIPPPYNDKSCHWKAVGEKVQWDTILIKDYFLYAGQFCLCRHTMTPAAPNVSPIPSSVDAREQ